MTIQVNNISKPVRAEETLNYIGTINYDKKIIDVTVRVTFEFLNDVQSPPSTNYEEVFNSNTFTIYAIADIKVEEILKKDEIPSGRLIIDVTTTDLEEYKQKK
ncbi:MAG: hypothetical protein WA916_08815 [Arcobacter sp.]|uniref:hypothetical protein n=1 Tax=Arcobacter sp. TaxID=1872629 RepID=UPI003C71D9B8